MAVINRAKLVKELTPGLNALFGMEYKRYENEHLEIFDVDTSTKAFEEDVKKAGFGAARVKAEGENVFFDEAQTLWTARYNHETIAIGFKVTEEAVEDNLYTSVSKTYVRAMVRSLAYTKQIKAASVLNLGFNSGRKGGDGKPLFANDHPLLSGSTYANCFSTPADLNETSLEAAIIAISKWTDERGLLVSARPLKLIIPQALVFTAERMLKSTLRPGTGDNDINVVRSLSALPQGFAVNHFLTDDAQWHLKTDIPNGLRFFQRKKVNTRSKMDDDAFVMSFNASERYSCGWSDPMAIFASPGS
jgi:hypothetical protein